MKNKLMSALSKVRSLLAGEPLRAIVYGSAVAVWVVAGISGRIPDITLDEALVQATAAAAILTEVCRRFVTPIVESLPEA